MNHYDLGYVPSLNEIYGVGMTERQIREKRVGV
jgi:hypothetical protein